MEQKSKEQVAFDYFEEVIFPLNYCQYSFLTQFQSGNEKAKKNFFKKASQYGVSEEDAVNLVNFTISTIEKYKQAYEEK